MVSKQDFRKIKDYLWEIPQSFRSDMRVPARIYVSEELWDFVESEALNQLINSATLPGITRYAIAMPDIHWGYGPPVGGVGATQLPDGVISPGFIGFDQNCGVRLLKSDYRAEEIRPHLERLATEIQREVPSGLGKGRKTKLSLNELDAIVQKGVPYLVEQGYGEKEDVTNCEARGGLETAEVGAVSERAKTRGRDQVGTLGSGNHFLEIQKVDEIFDRPVAEAFGLFINQAVIMIHSGSRGFGHQNCTDYLRIMERAMEKYKIRLPDRQLACVPFNSSEGQRFFAGMSAAANYAWANRHMIMHYTRKSWKRVLGEGAKLTLLYDVAHNIAKIEKYQIDGQERQVLVHRKGATRAFPPGSPEIPARYRQAGQPVLIPGSMGTASYVLVGTREGEEAFYTTAHGAGRKMSRTKAKASFPGKQVIDNLQARGIVVKSQSWRGIAEEAPGAYKDVESVVEVVHGAGLSRKVARLMPIAVIKGE